MKFLEAQRVLDGFRGGKREEFLLASSATLDPLIHYVRAEGALRGLELAASMLPFNTLGQELFRPPATGRREIFLLLPWDLVPELDWRSGVPAAAPAPGTLLDNARKVRDRILDRPGAVAAYLPAPVPSILGTPEWDRRLAGGILALVAEMGALILPASVFSLASYFASGVPIGSAALGSVGRELVQLGWGNGLAPAKVVVTDLDEVLWRGVLAEEGLEGIRFGADPDGYRHFLYQGVLARLQRDGILLAAVSRNSPDIVRAALTPGRMLLSEENFVAVLASYSAKSAQIRELAAQLNLGLDSFVFVDDNPVEIAEVRRELPAVRCVQFPRNDEELPAALSELMGHFPRGEVTAEDRERTDLYRRRLAGMVPVDVEGADLSDFLAGLQMKLTIRDCSTGDRTRAVQLINKTNQFNANGRRVTDEEVGAALRAGARLFTAALEDRTGSHGEILSCLVTPDGEIPHLVMSCRVFQRRVEYGFLTWLMQQPNPPRTIRFQPTERNEPFQKFLAESAFSEPAGGVVEVNPEQFRASHSADLELFRLTNPEG